MSLAHVADLAVAADPLELYAGGLQHQRRRLRARLASGASIQLDLDRWLGSADAADLTVIARATGPVLDIGCGPGRHVVACGNHGLQALGVDVSRAAVAEARRRGAQAVETCVFADVPDAGRWQTALLLDGNIGIGGDAPALLRRASALLAPDGGVIVEAGRPGSATVVERVRLECETLHSDWFPWARVAIDDLPAVASRAAMVVESTWECEGRWFARVADVA